MPYYQRGNGDLRGWIGARKKKKETSHTREKQNSSAPGRSILFSVQADNSASLLRLFSSAILPVAPELVLARFRRISPSHPSLSRDSPTILKILPQQSQPPVPQLAPAAPTESARIAHTRILAYSLGWVLFPFAQSMTYPMRSLVTFKLAFLSSTFVLAFS